VTLCKGSNRRGGRVAEGARLESVFTGNRNVGSNPTPSANICSQMFAFIRRLRLTVSVNSDF
jgi:hypothetical protein